VGDEETRAYFGIPPSEKAADLVVIRKPGQCVIAEVKGTDLTKALRQLENTTRYVKRKFPVVRPKVFVNILRSTSQKQSLGGGFRAMGSHREECLLADADGNVKTLDTGEQITVVFGF